MKRIISMLLALALVLGLCAALVGCGKNQGDSIVGKWSMSVDVGLIMGAIDTDSLGEMGDYVEFPDGTLKFNMEFTKDGKMYMEADMASFEKYMESMVDAIWDGVIKYGKDKGVSEADMEAQGLSREVFMDMMKSQFDTSTLDEMSEEYYYHVEGNKLYTSDDPIDTDKLDELDEDWMKMTLKGDTMTLDVGNQDMSEAPEGMEALLPLKLKRK